MKGLEGLEVNVIFPPLRCSASTFTAATCLFVGLSAFSFVLSSDLATEEYCYPFHCKALADQSFSTWLILSREFMLQDSSWYFC